MNGTQPTSSSQEAQLWNGILHKIRIYSELQSQVVGGLKAINVMHGNLASDSEPLASLKARLEKAYDTSRLHNTEERRALQEASEQLGQLIVLRKKSADTEIAQDKRGNHKKRKLDGQSPSATPSFSVQQHASTNSSDAVPSREDPMRKMTRREAQATLAEGRLVAFKPPEAKMSGDEKPHYIMARVLKSIGGDSYQVQDVEPEENGTAGAIFTTTMRSIVALPDPRDKSTFPAADYAPTTEVMALYPDTTTFYHGRVVTGPGANRKQAAYRVVFDEDNNKIQPVAIEHIAPWPK